MLAALALWAGGCASHNEAACELAWPDGYNRVSAASVNGPFAAQAARGAVLERTLWNEQFVPGAATLQPSAAARLDALAQRTTIPELTVFLQTAHDIGFQAGHAREYVEQRDRLDAQRAQSILDYVTAIRPEMACRVYVHDPLPPEIPASEAAVAVDGLYTSPAAVLILPPTVLGTSGSLLEVVTGEGGGGLPPAPIIEGGAGGLPEVGPDLGP